MGLTRLILIIAAGFVLYRIWRRWRERQAAGRPAATQDHGQMLACAHCHVYFPEQDAVREGDTAFCCLAHRDAHRHARPS